MSGRRKQPRIGVTGGAHGSLIPWLATRTQLRRAGAKPVRLSPRRPLPAEPLDALVLGGGSDVDPRLYGQSRQSAPSAIARRRRSRLRQLRRLVTAPARLGFWLFKRLFSIGALAIDPPRDALELELLRRAHLRRIPVLGICRGCQLINVFFGGTLHQDLAGFDLSARPANSVLPRKPVEIRAGSRLAELLGTTRCVVNGLHNQAVDATGRGLEIVAHDRHTIVQAVEHREHPFLIGVQWHPEYLPQKSEQRRLWRRLVAAADRRSEAEVSSISEKKIAIRPSA